MCIISHFLMTCLSNWKMLVHINKSVYLSQSSRVLIVKQIILFFEQISSPTEAEQGERGGIVLLTNFPLSCSNIYIIFPAYFPPFKYSCHFLPLSAIFRLFKSSNPLKLLKFPAPFFSRCVNPPCL